MKRFLAYVFAALAFPVLALAQSVPPSSGSSPLSATVGVDKTGMWGHKNLSVCLTWTNVQMRPNVTKNGAGREVSGPGVAGVYECTATSKTTTPNAACTKATLGQAQWHLLPPAPGNKCPVVTGRVLHCSVTQEKPFGSYMDKSHHMTYGQDRYYAVTNTWTLEGGESGYSNIALAHIVWQKGGPAATGCPASPVP